MAEGKRRRAMVPSSALYFRKEVAPATNRIQVQVFPLGTPNYTNSRGNDWSASSRAKPPEAVTILHRAVVSGHNCSLTPPKHRRISTMKATLIGLLAVLLCSTAHADKAAPGTYTPDSNGRSLRSAQCCFHGNNSVPSESKIFKQVNTLLSQGSRADSWTSATPYRVGPSQFRPYRQGLMRRGLVRFNARRSSKPENPRS